MRLPDGGKEEELNMGEVIYFNYFIYTPLFFQGRTKVGYILLYSIYSHYNPVRSITLMLRVYYWFKVTQQASVSESQIKYCI